MAQQETSTPTGGVPENKDFVNKKREDYFSWEDYYMSIAFLSAQRSKDPNTQVGACIVNEDKKIIGIGYNGMPIGCHDDVMPWNRESKDENPLTSKRLYVCHAELNAIVNKFSADLKGSTIYSTLHPCNTCAQLIIQSRIKTVVYGSDSKAHKPEFKAAKEMFARAEVACRQFETKRRKFVIDFSLMSGKNEVVGRLYKS